MRSATTHSNEQKVVGQSSSSANLTLRVNFTAKGPSKKFKFLNRQKLQNLMNRVSKQKNLQNILHIRIFLWA